MTEATSLSARKSMKNNLLMQKISPDTVRSVARVSTGISAAATVFFLFMGIVGIDVTKKLADYAKKNNG